MCVCVRVCRGIVEIAPGAVTQSQAENDSADFIL